MKFKSKTEAYSYAILLLNRMATKKLTEDKDYKIAPFSKGINHLKVAFENHEQDTNVVSSYLDELKNAALLSSEEAGEIEQLQEDLRSSDYVQTVKEKFKNPLARRYESELPMLLLLEPTPAMMTSVKRVSDQLLKIIDQKGKDFDNYLASFGEQFHPIALGSLKPPVSTMDIKGILKNNDPAMLAEIMHIHFKFAQNITRSIPITHAPRRAPVGKLAEIVQDVWQGNPQDFFSVGLAEKLGTYRSHICNLICDSPLYTAIRGRGRKGYFDQTRTHQLGLMLKDQAEHEVGLPQHKSSWAPDCKCQKADYTSPYVLDLVENDTVYVAGPSGMTSLFLSQMEMLANFENEDLKKNYLSAVVGYIVGGGFHSLHEVIGPAENALGLVPGYQIQVPSNEHRAPPPNYNQFFEQQAAIDPHFASRHEKAWQQYLTYFNDKYAPNHIAEFQHEESRFLQPQKAQGNIPKELKDAILSEINKYIKDGVLSRGKKDESNLSFISRTFRNTELTREKLKIATQFRTNLNSVTDLEDLKDLVKEVKRANKQAELGVEKTYGFLTKSGLNRAMESIETSIANIEQEQMQQRNN